MLLVNGIPKFDIIANDAALLSLSLMVLVVVAAVAANFVIAPSSLC
ncbi:MAG TPA: hypothetical protein VIP70_09080 [Nitrososphaeraceae archaeon]